MDLLRDLARSRLQASRWPELRRFLRLWAWRAIAVAESGYYEDRERARAGTGGGMLLEDALRQYRPGA